MAFTKFFLLFSKIGKLLNKNSSLRSDDEKFVYLSTLKEIKNG